MKPALRDDALPPPGLLAEMVREHLRRGRRITLRVGGLSMVPLLPPGVLLTLRPLEAREVPPPGALVVTVLEGHLVCHLLGETRESPSGSQVRTTGLLSDGPDPWISTGEVLGVVCEVRAGPWSVPWTSPAFLVWRRVAEVIAPALRGLKKALRPILPPRIRERVYRRLASPFGP